MHSVDFSLVSNIFFTLGKPGDSVWTFKKYYYVHTQVINDLIYDTDRLNKVSKL